MTEKLDITLTVNGRAHRISVEPRKTLVDAIREDCGLTGTHIGCEHGVCGACTVIVGGEAVRSCLMFAVQVQGKPVRTVLGAREDQERARIFIEQLLQQFELAILLDLVPVQVDVFGRLGGCADGDANGVADRRFDEVRHRLLDGRGKQQRLPVGRDGFENQLDGRQKAHVEHPVGFIEHCGANATPRKA